ncbi:MAG: hypothetical protein IJR93_00160 [Treponema sp.]|nr:hypothetical protein [Treponema sp.]
MAEQDIAEKRLEEYDDVFADIVNVLLFDGKPLVREDALSETSRLSQYKADDGLHEQERDIAKYWQDGNIRICLYGLENQTAVDADIPLRVVSYDGADYFVQMRVNKDYEPSRETIRHVHEVLQLMLVLSGNRKFEDAQNAAREIETNGGGSNMYDVLGKMIKDGRNEGLASAQTLMSRMFSEGRVDDLRRAAIDSDYLNQLLEEQGLLGEDAELRATS